MGLLGDLGSIAGDIAGGAVNTVEDTAKAAAHVGIAALDLGKAGVDGISGGNAGKDLGNVTGELGKIGGEYAANGNLVNNTVTGHVGDAFQWLGMNSDRAIATGLMMGQHELTGWNNPFDGQAWDQAWQQAKLIQKTDGAGAIAGVLGTDLSGVEALANKAHLFDWMNGSPLTAHQADNAAWYNGGDPLQYKNLYTDVGMKQNPQTTQVGGFLASTALTWEADPLVLAGKAAGAYRTLGYLGKLSDSQKAVLSEKLGVDFGDHAVIDSQTGLPIIPANSTAVTGRAATRVDGFLGFINGDNKLGRALNAREIFQTSQELRRNNNTGYLISSLLEQAREGAASTEEVLNRQRAILSLASGDQTASAMLKARTLSRATLNIIGDASGGQGPLHLLTSSVAEAVDQAPYRYAQMDGKLRAIDEAKDGALTEAVAQFQAANEAHLEAARGLFGDASDQSLAEVAGTQDFLPGHHSTDFLRLNRVTDNLAKDRVANWHAGLEDAAKSRAIMGTQAVFQDGILSAPLHAWGQALGGYAQLGVAKALSPLEYPSKVATALRQQHFEGMVSLDDWSGAMEQFDSALKIGGLEAEDRNRLLSEAARQVSIADRMRTVQKIQTEALKGIANGYNSSIQQAVAKAIESKGRVPLQIEPSYIEALVARQTDSALAKYSAVRSSQYSAAELPGDLIPDYAKQIKSPQDAMDAKANLAWLKNMPNHEAYANWRVDQIDDHGNLISLPLLESQLGNRVPMLDLNIAKRALRRNALADTLHPSNITQGEQFATLSQTYKSLVSDGNKLQERLNNAVGSSAEFIARRLRNVNAATEAVLHFGQSLMHYWKMGVLLRLGYPLRVVTDDNMRIMSSLGAAPYLGANVPEAFKNFWFNHAPKWLGDSLHLDTRGARMAEDFQQAATKVDSNRHLGLGIFHPTGKGQGWWEDHTHDDLDQIENAVRILRAKEGKQVNLVASAGDGSPAALTGKYRIANDAERAAAHQTLGRLDPDGLLAEHFHTLEELASARASAAAHRGGLSRLGDEPGVGVVRSEYDAKKLAKTQKMQAAEAKALALQESLKFPNDIHQELEQHNFWAGLTKKGITRETKAGLRATNKAHLGDDGVVLNMGRSGYALLNGSFAGDSGKAYKALVGRAEAEAGIPWSPQSGNVKLRFGSYRTYTPDDGAHLAMWAKVLNRQVKNSKVAMFFAEDPNRTVDDFVKWIKQPEQAYLRDQVSHFAVNPEDWGWRVKTMVDKLVPNQAIRDRLTMDGSPDITEHLLDKSTVRNMRPEVHGELVDVNTGRNALQRWFSESLHRTFDNIATKPTELLGRHPLFNAVYKQKLQSLANTHVAWMEHAGVDTVNTKLYADWERTARREALATVKRTLWDVSGHSHAAHTLRLVSPFFVAHQWALNRWWHIAELNPTVVPHIQQFFDDWRATGLVHDQNGTPVKKFDGNDLLGTNTNMRAWIRVPFMGENAGINKWIKDLGGGESYDFNLNGLNVILHAGADKPGLGPLASIPLQALANHFRGNGTVQAVANYFDGAYPKHGLLTQMLPASFQKGEAFGAALLNQWDGQMQYGQGNALFVQTFNMEQGQLHAQFLLDHGREPTTVEEKQILQQAGTRTTMALMRETLSNLIGFTPATDQGKFSAIEAGWKAIQSRGRAEGWDFTKMHEVFDQTFSSAYEPLLASASMNPVKLQGTNAEVNAIQQYGGLLGKLSTDPKDGSISPIAAMVIGPAAAMQGANQNAYNPDARTWEQQNSVGPGDPATWIGTKDPQAMLHAAIVNDGWNQFDQMTTLLTQYAKQQGLNNWHQSPALKFAEKQVVAQIGAKNPAWLSVYTNFNSKPYDTYLQDMETIVSDKSLYNDPARQDIRVLGEYLAVRKQITEILAQRKAQGGSDSMKSQSNLDLSEAMAEVVMKLGASNSYFQQYDVNRFIKSDPYLTQAIDSAGMEVVH